MSQRSKPRRHTRFHKLILVFNTLASVGCLVGAGALFFGNHLVTQQQKTTEIVNLATKAQATAGPTETFPTADPQAKNFLITGADNNACVDPKSPFAGAFGDRTTLGERSDTIMVMRVDPATNQAAVLSFPRDLWVDIAGRDSESRINSAYVKNDPQILISTIYQDFGIGIDHYIQVDFCAFKTLVDAVGGVPVPFEYPARDVHTGLNVPQAGCFNFTGDHALAYVRSRHYEYLDPKTGAWIQDPAADLGRISRQQDFLRRIIAKALSTGVYTPSVARGLISTAQKYVVTDPDLTLQRMLQFAGVIQHLDPTNLRSYQIESAGSTRAGSAVLIPRLGGANMKAVLAVFRGTAPLLGAPVQDPGQVSVDTTGASSTTVISSGGAVTTTTTPSSPTVVTTPDAPTVTTGAVENTKGIVPPKNVQC